MFTCYGCAVTPLPYKNLDCPDGYADYGTRWNQGLGRIVIANLHSDCSSRCTQFSGAEFSGGCRGYMTGMYYGFLYCRSYGRDLRTQPCAPWASVSSPGFLSGALGDVHPRTGQQNLGGNCCSNITFVNSVPSAVNPTA